MSRSLRKLIAVGIGVIYLVTVITTAYAQPSDISRHPAAAWINKWIEKGLVGVQSDGTFKPDDPIKRIDFFKMINRVFNYREEAKVSFADIMKNSPNSKEAARAVAAGYLKADGRNRVYPFEKLTRLDAAVILVKVFELKSEGRDEVGALSDAGRIPASGAEAVNIMLEKNYMGVQEDNRFNPSGTITRADAVMLADKIMGELYNKSGTYSGGIKTNVVINTGGVLLKNVTINGDLYLTEGINDGTVTFDGVTVKGKAIIHGGGLNSIAFRNSTVSGGLLVLKKDGKVRVTADGNSNIASVLVNSGAVLENTSVWSCSFKKVIVSGAVQGQNVGLVGNFDNVSASASGAGIRVDGNINSLEVEAAAGSSSISLNSGNIKQLNVLASRTSLYLSGGSVEVLNLGEGSTASKVMINGSLVNSLDANAGVSVDMKAGTVTRLDIGKNAGGSSVRIAKGASVTTLNANAGVTVSGQGSIRIANINSYGVTIEQTPSSVSIQNGITANIGGTSSIPVSTLSIIAADCTVAKGSTRSSVVTVIPADSTLTYSSDNTSIATVDSVTGLITGIGSGTTTVYVTGSHKGYFNSSAAFKVTVISADAVPGGTLDIDTASAVVGSSKTITLTYTPSGPTTNGTVTFTIPSGFTAATSDSINIAGTGLVSLNATQIMNNGQTVSISNVTLGANQNIVLKLNDKVIPAAGKYTFSAKVDSDGPGPESASSGTGSEAKEFESIARKLVWSTATFTEALANDGSIGTAINVTIENDAFSEGPFVIGTQYTVSNLPAGLTVNINRVSNTAVTITLTGKAASHTAADSISNLEISFKNAAFAGNNAGIVTNATKSNLTVSFHDP